MNVKRYLKIFAPLAVLVFVAIDYQFSLTPAQESQLSHAEELSSHAPEVMEEVYPYEIRPRVTLSSALRDLGVTPQEIWEIVNAAKPHRDLGFLQPGTRFFLNWTEDKIPRLQGIQFKFSEIEKLKVENTSGQWTAEAIQEPVEIQVVTFSGQVESSLWESAQQAEMDPALISELAEIFSWQVDFAREVRADDRWRLSVERHFVKGKPIGWGSILAAEYENAGELHTAALFRIEGKNKGYFAPDGTSLKRMFLKSPIKFGRISSRFQRRRFHPVLKKHRPHLGVDYAAPIGTPVRAVGAGTIEFAGWRGGGGKVIKVRHNSTYSTAYKHLNGYARGIRRGRKVEQGQIIGYVGTTGLSTGPHLHFEFYKSGRFVDPLGQKFPSADPVPEEHLAQFQTDAAFLLSSLPDWDEKTTSRKTAQNP